MFINLLSRIQTYKEKEERKDALESRLLIPTYGFLIHGWTKHKMYGRYIMNITNLNLVVNC